MQSVLSCLQKVFPFFVHEYICVWSLKAPHSCFPELLSSFVLLPAFLKEFALTVSTYFSHYSLLNLLYLFPTPGTSLTMFPRSSSLYWMNFDLIKTIPFLLLLKIHQEEHESLPLSMVFWPHIFFPWYRPASVLNPICHDSASFSACTGLLLISASLPYRG